MSARSNACRQGVVTVTGPISTTSETSASGAVASSSSLRVSHDLMLRDATLDACQDVKRRAERIAERRQRGGLLGLFRRRT